MPRSPLRRLVAAFCALWLAISIAEPAVLHACPMHDVAAPARHDVAGHGSHASHGSPAAHDHAGLSDDATPPAEHTMTCLCLGDCSAANTTGLLAARVTLVEARIIGTADAGLPDHVYLPIARALLLPFANGPPSLPPSTRVI